QVAADLAHPAAAPPLDAGVARPGDADRRIRVGLAIRRRPRVPASCPPHWAPRQYPAVLLFPPPPAGLAVDLCRDRPGFLGATRPGSGQRSPGGRKRRAGRAGQGADPRALPPRRSGEARSPGRTCLAAGPPLIRPWTK